LIADGERGALVSPSGDIVWMCMPSWDGDAVFCTLLGGEGTYAITPLGRCVWGGYYEVGSLIWRNRWTFSDGSILECRDALAYPGEPQRAMLLRHLEVSKGKAKVRVTLDLCHAFGRERPKQVKRTDGGEWTASMKDLYMRWTGGSKADHGKGGLFMEVELSAGEQHDFLLELTTRRQDLDSAPPDPQEKWSATSRSWELVLPSLDECVGRRDARHSYAVLRGLTNSRGGMVAAATTSLPERADSGRSYDYRYVWIRDQCWTGQAMSVVGPHDLLSDALRFVRERLLEDGSDLRPVYTPSGRKVRAERELKFLPGFPGGTKIVVGNRAGEQFQLDAFGEALLLFASAARQDVWDNETHRAAELAAQAIEHRWREKGAGVWETHPRHWTHSRLICAAGLRQMAQFIKPAQLAAHWMALAEAITAETAATAVHRTGYWQRAIEDDRLDAALLLTGLRGAVPPGDPRSLATFRAIDRHLVRDGYCYRFGATLPLHEGEGAFTVCGFWMSMMYLLLEDRINAARWFERTRAACGPPGLYAEEYDVVQRELRGNLPQAFVHGFMLECAARLGRELEKM
jgi:alpha,alpha-trehalase